MADDLTRLEDDLAQGRIDATAFRRRRDALLTAPAGATPAGGAAGPSDPDGGATVRDGVPEVAPPGGPFPPPFRWAPTRPVPGDAGHDRADATPPDPEPVLDPVPPPTVSPPPAVIPPPAVAPPRVADPPPAERTQVVPGARRPSPPVPAHATHPPWGLAPLAPPVRLDGVRRMQGAEVFVRPAPRRAGAVVGTLVVLVLALAVVVASFLL